MMCIEKVKGTDCLWWKAGTKQNVTACGESYNEFYEALRQV